MKKKVNYLPNSQLVDIYNVIFEQSPISTQIFTPAGLSIKANKAWEKLWNVKHQQILGYNILQDRQLKDKGSLAYIKRGFKGEIVQIPAIKYEPPKTVTIKNIVPFRWVKALIYPIKNSDGKIVQVVIQHEDITDHVLAQEKLMESQEKLKAVWDSAVDAMVLSDSNGKVIDANPAYYSLYGYSPDEILGKSFSVIFPKNKRAWANQVYRQAFTSSYKNSVVESTVTTKDGRQLVVESSYSFIVQNRQRLAMLSIIRNITQRKAYEEKIQSSEERLRLALEAGNIGVWDWDLQNNTLKWTDKVYELHGVPKQTPITLEYYKSLIHPEDKLLVENAIEKTLRQKNEFSLNLRVLPPGGEIKWLTTRAIAKYDNSGRSIRLLGATSDITDQKKLEQNKNDFIGIATHELKTPVTSLKAYAQVLQLRFTKSGDSAAADNLGKMNAQLDKLTNLIGDLLDATKIEAGKLYMSQDMFVFDKLVLEIVEQMQLTTDKHKLIVVGSTNKSIVADRERTGQVLTNLISNAIKYSPHSQKVLIKLKLLQNEIQVRVQDFGVGIPKNKQDKIFERFYRVSGPKEDTFPGLGLGLYISSEIIKRQGGKIWVDSAARKGSTFSFTLPLKKAKIS